MCRQLMLAVAQLQTGDWKAFGIKFHLEVTRLYKSRDRNLKSIGGLDSWCSYQVMEFSTYFTKFDLSPKRKNICTSVPITLTWGVFGHFRGFCLE